ncbi:hypothetical protein INR49_020657 [Caranx melampygus]|nr:hypothetical protein INR49_020657 [Caranx melampygus]
MTEGLGQCDICSNVTLSARALTALLHHSGPVWTDFMSVVVEEASFVPCEQLNFGRISFKGFNPDVEVGVTCEPDVTPAAVWVM